MLTWIITIIYAAAVIAAGVVMYRYREWRDTQKPYTILKMVASVLFIVMGIYGYFISGNPAFAWMAPALVLCSVGDLFLALGHEIDNKLVNPQFIIGVYAFAAAQVFYSLVILRMMDWHVSWTIIIPFVVLGYTIFCTKNKDYEFGRNAVPCCVYGFLVGLTGGLGLQMLLTYPEELNCMFMGIGAILFLVSDGILSMKLFWKKETPWAGWGVLIFYFGAMWLLANSIGAGI